MVAQREGGTMCEKKPYRFLGSFTLYTHGCGGGSYFSGEMYLTPEQAEVLKGAGAEMEEVVAMKKGGGIAMEEIKTTPIPPPYASNSGW